MAQIIELNESYRDGLEKQWAPVIEVEGLKDITSAQMKRDCAVILENTYKRICKDGFNPAILEQLITEEVDMGNNSRFGSYGTSAGGSTSDAEKGFNGVKGGAAGGGYSQVVPMEDINLHFTGDIHAISIATNLIASLIDNSIHQGNPLNIDPRTVSWKRCVDLNDRALRSTIIGLGGSTEGVPREQQFSIAVASEIMAIICLSKTISDLKQIEGLSVRKAENFISKKQGVNPEQTLDFVKNKS